MTGLADGGRVLQFTIERLLICNYILRYCKALVTVIRSGPQMGGAKMYKLWVLILGLLVLPQAALADSLSISPPMTIYQGGYAYVTASAHSAPYWIEGWNISATANGSTSYNYIGERSWGSYGVTDVSTGFYEYFQHPGSYSVDIASNLGTYYYQSNSYYYIPGSTVHASTTVNVLNVAPTLQSLPDQTLDAGQALQVTANAFDYDALSYTWDLNHAGTFNFATGRSINSNLDVGSYVFTVRVSDGYGGTAERDFSVQVNAPVEADPLATPLPSAASAGLVLLAGSVLKRRSRRRTACA
jgi:hypothetical protein